MQKSKLQKSKLQVLFDKIEEVAHDISFMDVGVGISLYKSVLMESAGLLTMTLNGWGIIPSLMKTQIATSFGCFNIVCSLTCKQDEIIFINEQGEVLMKIDLVNKYRRIVLE